MIDKLETHLNGEERGMTGIGVLILFIALVLVAAIASGVILDTAGFLQNRAQDTGEDSTKQVSNRLTVLSASGEVVSANVNNDNTSEEYVGAVNISVFKSPGADEVDLEHATIEYLSPHGSEFLTYASQPLANGQENFSVSPIKDEDGSNPVLNTQDDRASINMNLNTTAGADGSMRALSPGDKATIRISTQHGAVTTYIINVPESLSNEAGSSVLL